MSRRRGQRYVDELVAEFTGSTEPSGLTSAQQEEVVLKLRYGIYDRLLGLSGPQGSTDQVRRGSEVVVPLSGDRPELPAQPSPPLRSDAEIRARAAALGVTVGRRGQWIR